MPGIFGIISRNKENNDNLGRQFAVMKKLLSHLDYYETESVEGSGFIMGRIGIPYRGFKHIEKKTDSGNIILLDGFVYSRCEDKTGKQRQIAEPTQAFNIDGDSDFVSNLDAVNGSYTCCMYDSKTDSFYLGTDHLGFRRLYYYQDEKIIAFAPEIKAFMALDSFSPNLDNIGLADFANYGFVIGNRTLYEDCHMLSPASFIKIENRNLQPVKEYWQMTFETKSYKSLFKASSELYEMGFEVARRQIGSHNDFIMALSGGLDSRLLAHYLQRSGTNTFYYTHGHRRSLDARLARQVADTIGATDKFKRLDNYPLCFSELGPWTVWITDGMVQMNEAEKASMVGQYTEDPRKFEFMSSLCSGAFNFSICYSMLSDISCKFTTEEKIKRLYGMMDIQDDLSYYNLFSSSYKEQFLLHRIENIRREFDRLSYTTDEFFLQKEVYSILTRVLRLSQQYDIWRFFYNEHPALIDYEIFDSRNKIPIEWLVDRILYINIFTDLLPELASIRYQKTGVDLYSKPGKIKKSVSNAIRGFKYYMGRASLGKINLYDYSTYVYQNIWYRKYPKNRKFFEDLLLAPRTLDRGIFNPAEVRTILKKQAHGSGCHLTIGKLAAIELFHRYFIDGDAPPIDDIYKFRRS